MRAIIIDPEKQTVTEVEHDGGYENLRKLVGGIISAVCIIPINDDHQGETLYIDDEGLLKDDPEFFFTLCGSEPYAGHGVLLGLDEDGSDISTCADLNLVRKHVEFKRLKIAGWTETKEEPDADMPWGGKGFKIVMPRPIFEDRDKWEREQAHG